MYLTLGRFLLTLEACGLFSSIAWNALLLQRLLLRFDACLLLY